MTQGRITSPFTARGTAAEVVAAIDLRMVTGGSPGIGTETARALASAGADVTLAGRNPDTAASRRHRDQRQPRWRARHHRSARPHRPRLSPQPRPVVGLDTPARARQQRRHHVRSTRRTPIGWELQFATNHLGQFALATALDDALAAANARIVSVSSGAHLCSPVDLDDINFNRRDYDPWLGCGQSKTVNVLFAVEATRRCGDDGITTNALHPGSIWTNLIRYLTAEEPTGADRGSLPPDRRSLLSARRSPLTLCSCKPTV